MKNLSIKNSISHYIICQLYTCTHNLTQKKKKIWHSAYRTVPFKS